MRGEGLPALGAALSLWLAAAISAGRASLGTGAPRACGQRLAAARPHTHSGKFGKQNHVFRQPEMDTPSPPEREHVPEGADASEGLSKQPL